MKFHQLGLIDYDENHAMTHKLVKEILILDVSRELIVAIQAYWRIWKSLAQEIRNIEKELKKQAETDPNEPTYRSVPGVGNISARILSNELGNMSQFLGGGTVIFLHGVNPLRVFQW